MKKNSFETLITILLSLTLLTSTVGLLTGCGNDSPTEETVVNEESIDDTDADASQEKQEINEEDTTVSTTEEETATNPSNTTNDENNQETTVKADYKKIYNTYSHKMDKATSMDNLESIFKKGKEKMLNAMLASTEDDDKQYRKWFNALNEKYTSRARELTD